jgi:hypothetical protein
MAISKIGGTASDNWVLISSVTPTAASAAVNFTGLTPYAKLLLIWDDTVLAATGSVSVRLNNDSGSNYVYTNVEYSSAAADKYTNNFSIFGTEITFSISGTNPQGMVEIHNCDTTGLKNIVNGANSGVVSGTRNLNQFYGYYKGSAIVTQINLITSSTFNASGTVYLYGVK